VILIAEKLRTLKSMKPYPAEKFLAIIHPIALQRPRWSDALKKQNPIVK
jgi:hypothetical protein